MVQRHENMAQFDEYRKNNNTLNLEYKGITDRDMPDLLLYLETHKEITHLELRGNNLTIESARGLADNETLHFLDISYNRFGTDFIEIIATTKTLTTLNVSGNYRLYNKKEGVLALAANKSIKNLYISNNFIGDKEVMALLATNDTITVLDLSDCTIGDKGAAAIAANQFITVLDLRNNRITSEGAKALAANQTLKWLDLCCNSIGCKGASAFAMNQSLLVLKLAYNKIGAEGAKCLAANRTFKTLDLYANNIQDQGCIALASHKKIINLNVSYNNIGDAGAKALAENRRLITLDISRNYVSDAGALAFKTNKTIKKLKMSDNRIGDMGAEGLAYNRTLTTLDLNGNLIKYLGSTSESLIENETLASLDLGCNSINLFKLREIASKNLKTLRIETNYMGNEEVLRIYNHIKQQWKTYITYMQKQQIFLRTIFPDVLCDMVQQYVDSRLPTWSKVPLLTGPTFFDTKTLKEISDEECKERKYSMRY